jgi:hypothetical protein
MSGKFGAETSLRLGTHQSVAYTGTAGTIANAFGDHTRYVRVVVTSAAHVKVGKSPTATTSDVYMAANVPEIFRTGAGEKVSAVQVSAGGNLHVTELTA